MNIQFQDAIKNAKTFAELLPIAERVDAKLSFFGRQYAVMQQKNDNSVYYTGEVAVGALVTRALQIIEESSYSKRNNYPSDCPERKYSELLDIQINRIYDMDKKNTTQCNIITKVAIVFRCISVVISHIYSFILTGYTSHEIDHQLLWNDHHDFGCSGIEGLDRHILPPIRPYPPSAPRPYFSIRGGPPRLMSQ